VVASGRRTHRVPWRRRCGHVEPSVRAPGRPPVHGCATTPPPSRLHVPAIRPPSPAARSQCHDAAPAPASRITYADGEDGADPRGQGAPVESAAHEHPRGGDDGPAGDPPSPAPGQQATVIPAG
jgi:hypothetical protein